MIGGTPIYTQSYTLTTDAKVILTGTVPVVSGNQYTFNLSALPYNMNPRYHFSNPYATGDAYWNNSKLGAGTHDWAFEVSIVPPCVQPDVPVLTSSATSVCEGNSATLNITGNLNGATEWNIYTGSCGGTSLGTTTSSSFVVTPGSPSTTYYVRGEGACASSGSCGTITINVNSLDDASFNFSSPAYCTNGTDPSPNITGLTGGALTSSSGLSINPITQTIDLSASTPGTYTVTYTTNGTCPNSSDVNLTVNALDDASFNYSSASYCLDASDPTPTITGTTGGTFTGTPGLVVNGTSGTIDLTASGAGNYLITYTTNGVCPNSSLENVIVQTVDDASFSFSASAYCINDTDPTPNITGQTGGTFTSTPGLNINPITHTIDLSASAPGTYPVTYTTTGACPSSSDVNITINNTSSGIDIQSACGSYTWIDGNTYSSSNNTATYTLTNALGCDSVVTLDLTINTVSTGIDTQTACNSFTWIDGNTYTSSNNTATHTLTNTIGCDSIVTLNLTINNASTGIDTQTACNSYTWIDGNTYTSSNNAATLTLANAAGCDSIVTLNLTITTIDATVATNDLTITANAGNMQYQWIDCDNGNSVIQGEDNQSFTASVNGDYAVIVSDGNCSDTSNCVSITTVGLQESNHSATIAVYPNPATNILNLSSSSMIESVLILDMLGAVVRKETSSTFSIEDLIPGVYLIDVKTTTSSVRTRFVKQ